MCFGEALMGALDTKSLIAKVRILVVDDDLTCLTVIGGMLKFVGYEVVTVQDPLQALSTLAKKSKKFDLVLSDIHMPSMNGFELQKHIQNEFNIPVIFMSGDDNRSIAMQGLKQGASFFILKPPKVYDLENLWQYIVTNNTSTSFGESIEKQSIEKPISCMGMLVNDPNEDELHSLFLTQNEDNSCLNNNHNKPKLIGASEDMQENEIESKRASTNSKKSKKLVWTTSLHNKFLHAINIIGHDNAVPKKILEYMNVPGLTRENIASHLQKYRIYCRKNEEAGKGSTETVRPFRSVLAWSQYPPPTTNNLLLNFPNVTRQVQPQPTQPPHFMPNLGSLNFGGSQSLMNNTLANINNNNNNFVDPMMNNNDNFVHPIMNNNNNNLVHPMNNNNLVHPMNNNNLVHPMNNNLVHPMNNNHHAYAPNQLSIVESSMLGGQHNNQVVQNNQMGFPFGLSSGFYQVGGSSTNNGLWNSLPHSGDEFWNIPLPGENNNLGGFVCDNNNNNNIALQDNNITFNGINIQQGINQLQLQGPQSTYIDPIAANNQVVEQQAFDMSYLNNNNNNNIINNIHVAHQQVPLVDNNINDDDALQVIRPVEPNHEMSNIDLLHGSSSDYQDFASLNLDDPPLGGIDELFGFLSSNNNDLNNGSSNELP